MDGIEHKCKFLIKDEGRMLDFSLLEVSQHIEALCKMNFKYYLHSINEARLSTLRAACKITSCMLLT